MSSMKKDSNEYSSDSKSLPNHYIYAIMFRLGANSTATLNMYLMGVLISVASSRCLMSCDALRVVLAVDQEIHAMAKILFNETIVQETTISTE
eukprot:scaffold641685_cov23-Prasinocladus_malaysianus.AAC.1